MSDIEPLTVIDFRYMPFQYHQHIMKVYFEVIDPEINGKKAGKLVRELEYRLKNFKQKWGTISCSLTLLDMFSFWQVHGKVIRGCWHSVHFSCRDSAKNDNIRRRNYGKVASLINQEIKSWKFRHYKTILTCRAESK